MYMHAQADSRRQDSCQCQCKHASKVQLTTRCHNTPTSHGECVRQSDGRQRLHRPPQKRTHTVLRQHITACSCPAAYTAARLRLQTPATQRCTSCNPLWRTTGSPQRECRPYPGLRCLEKKCYTVLTQLRCKRTAGTKGGSRNDKGRLTNPTSKGSKHTLSVPSGVGIGVATGGSCVEHWVERDD
jgi:hypothetical protein